MKKMVIFTKYYGANFTGATIATTEFVTRWIDLFDEIIIITKNIGEYTEYSNLKIKKVKNIYDYIKEIKKTEADVYYNDDHLGFLGYLAKKKYIHTYHASWPEARWLNKTYFIKSFGFIFLYKLAIKKAKCVITVSEKYNKWVKRYNLNSVVIRNGIGHNKKKHTVYNCENNKSEKILMIGNIDQNKYKHLLRLLELKNFNKEIDIYGKIIDEKVFLKLKEYKNINIKGFQKNIEFDKYKLFLNTSKNENLSIAICEAINHKVPVVAFDIGALNEVVINGENGILIEKYDVVSMNSKLNSILDGDIKFDYYKDVLSLFDWNIAAERYMKVFEGEL